MHTTSLTIVLLAQVNIGLIANVVLAIVAVCSFIFGIYQYRKRSKEKQSEVLANLMEDFKNGADMQSFFQMIDYGETWYGPQFHNKPIETAADNTFRFFEKALKSKENGSLMEEDFTFFKYHIDKTVRNRDTQTYFFNLFHYLAKQPDQIFPYQRIVNYAKQNGFLDAEEFGKRDSAVFQKVLDF